MITIYINETCPYCKQVKEELTKNNIEYTEKLINSWPEEWSDIVSLTGVPSVPTVEYKDNYFIPGRDFRSATNLVEVINKYKDSKFTIDRRILEQIRTLNYNIHMAFGRTDQILRQIENKLNQENND
jgi:glutaredoxin